MAVWGLNVWASRTSDTFEGKLWEMRVSGNRLEGRALYVAAIGRRVVVVLAFVKKTRKTPDRYIRLVLERARRIGS